MKFWISNVNEGRCFFWLLMAYGTKGNSRIPKNAECPFPSSSFQAFFKSPLFSKPSSEFGGLGFLSIFGLKNIYNFDIEHSALVSFSTLSKFSYSNTNYKLERVNLKLSIPGLAAQQLSTTQHPTLTASKAKYRNERAYSYNPSSQVVLRAIRLGNSFEFNDFDGTGM